MNAHHHQHDDIDWEAHAERLEREGELHLPFLEPAGDWLREQLTAEGRAQDTGLRVLDVGSGPGVFTCLLARHFPQGTTVAVDGTESLLDRCRERAAAHGLEEHVVTRLAQLPEDLGDLGAADLIWTSRTLHHLGDQQDAVNQLAGLLRPGGVLAIGEGGLPFRCLPRDIGLGRPGLQSRIDAALEDWFAGMRAELPSAASDVEDWTAMLSHAGLEPSGTRSFLTDVPAPLGVSVRSFLHSQFEGVREKLADYLDAEDQRTLDTLLDPEDPAGILRRPDAFCLTANTVHTARAPH